MKKKLGKKNISFVAIGLFFLPIFLFAKIEFTQKVSKQNIYINETIKVTLILKIDDYHNIEQVYLEDFESSDFWYKKHEDKIVVKEENSTSYIYSYLIDAKSIGNFTLPKQLIEISNNEIKNYRRWQKVYSNETKINVNPLVENLPIQGNYEINATVNKNNINENDSVKLMISLKGSGNLKDIKPFDLNLNKQVVYANKPNLNQEFKQTKYFGDFTQEFLIIANESFTIKPFEFTYYNTNKNRVEKISTKPIYVEVKKLTKDYGDESWIKYLFLLIGLFIGIGLSFIYLNYKRKKSLEELPLVVKIKKTKNDKELYKVLIAHSNEYNFKEEIEKLEENIYRKAKNKINKKELLNRVIY